MYFSLSLSYSCPCLYCVHGKNILEKKSRVNCVLPDHETSPSASVQQYTNCYNVNTFRCFSSCKSVSQLGLSWQLNLHFADSISLKSKQ